MLTCPMCKKSVAEETRSCPRCNTDLGLLADYVRHLNDGLARAEALTRRGELGEAVWAYLNVLEVDPENASARKQVGQVAAAVRQFDRRAPGRRWAKRLGRQARVRRWLHGQPGDAEPLAWLWVPAVAVALALAFAGGYSLGRHAATVAPTGPVPEQPVAP